MEIEQAKKILEAAAAAVNQLGESQAQRHGGQIMTGVALSPGSAGPPPSHGQQATTSTSSDNAAGTGYTLDRQPAEAEATVTFEQYFSKESTPAKRKFRV